MQDAGFRIQDSRIHSLARRVKICSFPQHATDHFPYPLSFIAVTGLATQKVDLLRFLPYTLLVIDLLEHFRQSHTREHVRF